MVVNHQPNGTMVTMHCRRLSLKMTFTCQPSNLSLTPVMMRKKIMKFCNLKKVQYLESKRVLRKGGARYRICVEKTVLDRREWCLILGWKDGENTFVSAITPSPRHYWQEIYDHTSSHNALPSQIALVNYPYISQFLNLSSWMS